MSANSFVHELGNAPSVLITGGAGFIGSHLCQELLELGVQVTVMDDLRAGSLSNLPIGAPNLIFEQIEVGNSSCIDLVERVIERSDFVFHLASPVGVRLAHDAPKTTFDSIYCSGLQVAELCLKHECPILFTSSSEVYGCEASRPTAESEPLTSFLAPRLSYAAAKIAVEQLIVELFEKSFIDSWVVRFFNIAGPRQRPDSGVMASYCYATANGGCLQIHGDGEQTRSFLHVKDAVEALILIAGTKNLRGRAVNIGSENPVSINDLANLVSGHRSGMKTSYSRYNDEFGDGFLPIFDRLPDTRLLRTSTGWRPSFSLHEIVRDCIDHTNLAMTLAARDG